MPTIVTMRGASGAIYRMTVHRSDKFFPERPGIYVVMNSPERKGGSHEIVGIGESDFSVRSELRNDPDIDELCAQGANRFGYMLVNGTHARQRIIDDILAGTPTRSYA